MDWQEWFDSCRATIEDPRKVVSEQAEDEGLWFIAETAPEAYLQAALRRLHKAVEDFLDTDRAIMVNDDFASWWDNFSPLLKETMNRRDLASAAFHRGILVGIDDYERLKLLRKRTLDTDEDEA